MESSIIKEIGKKQLDSYFEKRKYEAMYYPTFFPTKKVLRLDYTTLVGEQAEKIAAHVISYDSASPIHKRQVVSKVSGDIPKISVKRAMKESDMNDYLMLSAMATPDEKAILDLIYEDVDYVVDACNARHEWICLQALSKTKVTLSATNNPMGIITEEAVDFQMPTANKSGATVSWYAADKSTTKPITDIKSVVKSARALGKKLRYIFMNPELFDEFIASTEVISYMKAFYQITDAATISLENLDVVNKVLVKNQLPEIKLIDQSVGIENKAGTVSYVNPFDKNYVLFAPDLTFGNTLAGPIAEEKMPPKQATQSKAGLILVSKFSNIDPLTEFTKGEANLFPSWKNINNCFSLKADNTVWS